MRIAQPDKAGISVSRYGYKCRRHGRKDLLDTLLERVPKALFALRPARDALKIAQPDKAGISVSRYGNKCRRHD